MRGLQPEVPHFSSSNIYTNAVKRTESLLAAQPSGKDPQACAPTLLRIGTHEGFTACTFVSMAGRPALESMAYRQYTAAVHIVILRMINDNAPFRRIHALLDSREHRHSQARAHLRHELVMKIGEV